MVKLNLFFHVLVPLMVVGDMGKSVLSYWALKFCKGKWSKGEGLTKQVKLPVQAPSQGLNIKCKYFDFAGRPAHNLSEAVSCINFCHVPFIESWKVCRPFVLKITEYNFGWVDSKWIVNFIKDPKTVPLVKYIC